MKARKNAQTPSTKTCKHASMPGKRASQHAHAESTQTREYAKHAISRFLLSREIVIVSDFMNNHTEKSNIR